MKKSILFVLLFIGVIISMPIDAQKEKIKENPEQLTEQRMEMRAALKNYRQKEIRPILLEYRKAFEQRLSSKERELLETVRQNRKEHRTARRIAREQGIARERPLSKGNHEAVQNSTHRAQLRSIVANHQKELDEVFGILSKQRSKWKADLRAIRAKYQGETKLDNSKSHPHRKQKGLDNEGKKQLKQDRKYIRFLLMPV